MKLDKKGSEENKKAKFINLKNKKVKRIVIGSVGVVLVAFSTLMTMYGLYGYTPDYSDKTLEEVLSSNFSEETINDLLMLNDKYNDLISEVATIETRINLQNKLSKLDLEKYNKNLNICDVSSLNETDVELLIEQFEQYKDVVDLKTPNKETNQFYKIVSMLTSYENNLNTCNEQEVFLILNTYSNLIINLEIYNSLNLPIDSINNTSNNLLSSPTDEFITLYKDSNTGKEYTISTSHFNSMNKLVSCVRELSKLIDSNKLNDDGSIKSEYREEITTKEKQVINEIKNVLMFNYKIEEGVIHQEGNNLTRALSK